MVVCYDCIRKAVDVLLRILDMISNPIVSEEDFELLRVFDTPEDVVNAVQNWYNKREITGRKALTK